MRDFLIDRAQEDGKVAAALDEEPPVPEHLEPVLELFYYLSNQRPFTGGGMGMPMPRPIPIQDIWTTAPSWHLDPVYFLRVTAQADALYIEHLNEQIERVSKKATQKSNGRHR